MKPSGLLSPLPSSGLVIDNNLEDDKYEFILVPGERQPSFSLSAISWPDIDATKEPTQPNQTLNYSNTNEVPSTTVVGGDSDDKKLENLKKTVTRKLDLHILPLLAYVKVYKRYI